MSAHAAERSQTVNQALSTHEGRTILLAGDSHIENAGTLAADCGGQIVNAGLSGATSQIYTQFIGTLSFPRKVDGAVLTIGTNDALRKRRIGVAQFQKNSEAIIKVIAATTQRLVVTAIPPVTAGTTELFDPAAIEAFSKSLAETCRQTANCEFADPYASIRLEGRFGIGRDDALPDGVHLNAYRDIYRQVAMCVPTDTAAKR